MNNIEYPSGEILKKLIETGASNWNNELSTSRFSMLIVLDKPNYINKHIRYILEYAFRGLEWQNVIENRNELGQKMRIPYSVYESLINTYPRRDFEYTTFDSVLNALPDGFTKRNPDLTSFENTVKDFEYLIEQSKNNTSGNEFTMLYFTTDNTTRKVMSALLLSKTYINIDTTYVIDNIEDFGRCLELGLNFNTTPLNSKEITEAAQKLLNQFNENAIFK